VNPIWDALETASADREEREVSGVLCEALRSIFTEIGLSMWIATIEAEWRRCGYNEQSRRLISMLSDDRRPVARPLRRRG
jgi:hypothetical protein